jgi:ATP-binding cassette subfamily B protein
MAQDLLRPLMTVVDDRLYQEMQDQVVSSLQRKTQALRLEAFERSDFHDILGRAQEAADPGIILDVLWSIGATPQAAVTIAAMGALVAAWDPWLLVGVLVAAVPSPLAQIVQSRSRFFVERQQTADERLRGYYADILLGRGEAKEVRAFDMAPWVLQRWRALFWSVANRIHRVERRHSLGRAGLNMLSVAGYAAALAVAAWGVAHGTLSSAHFAAMLWALRAVQQEAGAAVRGLHFLGGESLKLADLFIFLDLGPEEPPAGGGGGTFGDLEVCDVSFRYPQVREPAISGITFRVRAGERVALVGENGSGKTTLVKVLTGLYRPTTGQVRCGGRDLTEWDPQRLRAGMAAVFQDHVRFAFTLGENVGYGDAGRMADRDAVAEAAGRGGADAVASALPLGFDTLLTRQFTGGTDLSGGQWQRVAVSRGFMRDAPFLVLDEPTAALDPVSEADVFRRFAAMAAGRTAILVSHRLGSARLCDRVLVLREGRLVEQGTHDELLAAGGDYARLWALQAQWYQ